MTTSARYCLVCNAPLTSAAARAEKRCGAGPCRTKPQAFPLRPACAVCGKHLTLREQPTRVCSNPQCRVEHLHSESVRRRERIRVQAEDWRERGGQTLGVDRPRSYPLTVIPSLTVPLVNVAERRRRAFRDRLMELISEAASHRNTPTWPTELTETICNGNPPVPEHLSALLGAACGICQGHCCATGSIHAYLSVDTIRQFMDANPTLRPRDVLAAYLSYLPNRALKGSCIYHTTRGCALPRDMRSEISRRFFCEPLWEFQRKLADTDERKGFVAAADDQAVVRAAFLSERDVRPVPKPSV